MFLVGGGECSHVMLCICRCSLVLYSTGSGVNSVLGPYNVFIIAESA